MADSTAADGTDGSPGGSGSLPEPSRRVLGAIYALLRERSVWPTFRTVDLRLDRRLGISDTQAALAAVPAGYLQRAWRSAGFYDNDEVRLSLRGVEACEGGLDDLELLTSFVQWACEIEQEQDLADESDPVAMSIDFAARAGLSLEADRDQVAPEVETAQLKTDRGNTDEASGPPPPTGGSGQPPPVSAEAEANRAALARLRVLAELLPRFWSGIGWQEPWRWQFTIDRRGLRSYRQIGNVGQLLSYVDHERDTLIRQQATAMIHWNVESQDSGTATEAVRVERSDGPDEIDVLLTLLRPEIAEAATAQLRGSLYDDAIFAAYRRVEAAVQQRSRLAGTIGDTLIRQAFMEASAPIKVSGRTQDADRLIQLFGGAIGLYKGDRSHKDKPALPCRSLRECLRQLANASALLDLLDRDIAIAPAVRGYDQHGDTLELWVERASAQAEVWLDDHLCNVVRHGPGSLVLDVTGVPAGEHELFITDGTRTGPVTEVWLTRSPGGSGWQRVSEVNIPLFRDRAGLRMSATGLRLTVRENGIISDRIVPTTGTYRVGDYVSPHYSRSALGDDPGSGSALGPAWVEDGAGSARRQVWESAALFDGQPYAPEHEPRLMRVTLEPHALILRPEEKVPVQALGHYTDGVATWTGPLTDCIITSDSEKTVFVNDGTAIAKGYGRAVIRLAAEGLYAAATVHVAAHPAGTLADVLTGLPPIAGIAWADDGLIISTRTEELWKLGRSGKYRLAAAVPLQPPVYGGTDTVAAAENGDLAVRLLSYPDVLVLDRASDYRKSRWVSPGEDATVMAVAWDGPDVILALHTGSIRRFYPDGTSKRIIKLSTGPITSIDSCEGVLLAWTAGETPQLSRITLSAEGEASSSIIEYEPGIRGIAAWLNGSVYFTDFYGGRVFYLAGEQAIEVAAGLQNPTELATGLDGSIYIAESGRGALRRLLPG